MQKVEMCQTRHYITWKLLLNLDQNGVKLEILDELISHSEILHSEGSQTLGLHLQSEPIEPQCGMVIQVLRVSNHISKVDQMLIRS